MDCGIEFDRKNWREIISPREAKVTAMADECDVDNVTALFDDCQIIFDGEPAKEVVYVLGMLIAHAIKEQATDKNPEATFVALREIVAIELK